MSAGRERDADAGRDPHVARSEDERLLRASSQIRSATSIAGRRVVDAGEHDRELVAAHPGDEVAGPDAAAQAAATRDEELVAGVVAEAVVHVLEAVEVEEQHRERVAGPAPAAHALQLLVEAAAVRAAR